MKKLDPIVWRETRYVALWVLILSAVTEAVFLLIGQWNYTVLLGNLLGAAAAVGNFLLMGLAVQKAVGQEEKEARQVLKLSMTLRTFLLFAVLAVGVLLPVFSTWTVILPVFFPRIAIALRPIFLKDETPTATASAVSEEMPKPAEEEKEETDEE